MASEREGLSFCCLARFSIATRKAGVQLYLLVPLSQPHPRPPPFSFELDGR